MSPRISVGSRPRSACERGSAATLAQDATSFAFRCSAPHPLFDVVLQRVLEALVLDGARSAHPLRGFDADPIGGEELAGVCTAAESLQHPRIFVRNFVHVGNLSATLEAA